MTDVIERLSWASFLLGSKNLVDRAWAIDEAERLLRDPASSDDVFEVEKRRQLANNLEYVRWLLDHEKKTKPRKPSKPTLAATLKQADKAGKAVRSATVAPDGTLSIAFGEPAATESTNPWNAEIEKLSKQ